MIGVSRQVDQDILDVLELVGLGAKPPRTSQLPETKFVSAEEFLEAITVPVTPPITDIPNDVSTLSSDDLALFEVFGKDTERLKKLLHTNVAKKLVGSRVFSLAEVSRFQGDGVYALYYHGNLEMYRNVKERANTYPIYIGKSAQPARSSGKGQSNRGRNMFSRLREHARSLRQAGFPVEAFTYRLVILDPEWVDLSETALVGMLRPTWNSIIHGFGSRACDLDNRAKNGGASSWDVLHSGRRGAGIPKKDRDTILSRLEEETPECIRIHYETINKLNGE